MPEVWIDLKEGLALKKEELAEAEPTTPEAGLAVDAPSTAEATPAPQEPTPQEDAAAEAAPPEEAKGKPSRSARLRAQRDRERDRAASLEAEVQQLKQALWATAQQSQQQQINAAVAYEKNLEVTTDAIKQALLKAKADGDFAAEVAAEEKLAAMTWQKQNINAWKSQQRPAAPPPQQAPQAPPPAEAALAWAEENGWFNKDKKATRLALAINASLLEEGIDPESEEFYVKLDEELASLGVKKPSAPKGNGAARPSSPVAPAQRSAAPPGRVRLDEGQVRMSQRLGVKPLDYARATTLQKNEQGYDLIDIAT